MLRDVERAANPWGKPQTERAAWAEELGVRVLEPGDPAPEYLYWVGCAASFDERASERGGDGEAAAEGGRRLRDPRPARGVHGRPGAPDGERVRLPGVRRAERRDAERAGRQEDRRELPALLQHARERVPRLRRRLRGRPPLASCSRELVRTGGCSRNRAARTITYHDSLLPRAPQRRARGAAEAPARDRAAGRDEAERQADVLLRRRRRAHVDGGARGARSTRSARARRPRRARRRSRSRARSAR